MCNPICVSIGQNIQYQCSISEITLKVWTVNSFFYNINNIQFILEIYERYLGEENYELHKSNRNRLKQRIRAGKLSQKAIIKPKKTKNNQKKVNIT